MHLYLIGYRGSGKSTVGRLLSQSLQRPMVDTDDWIESAEGKPIREIFAELGEEGFRQLEQTAVAQVAQLHEPAIVSTGGGAVLREANRLAMMGSGRCIWLDAPAQLLYQRIFSDSSSGNRRPNLTDRGGLEEVNEVLAIRRPIYSQMANLIVDIEGKQPEEICREIVDWVNINGLSQV